MSITSIYAQRAQGAAGDLNFVPEAQAAGDKRFEEYIGEANAKAPEKPKANEAQNGKPKIKADKPDKPKKTDAVKEKGQENLAARDAPKDEAVQAEQPVNAEKTPTAKPEAVTEEADKLTVQPAPVIIADETAAAATLVAPVLDLAPAEAAQTVAAPQGDAQVIQAIADKLDITPDEVTEILSELDKTPADLMNGDKLRAFVREVFGVNTNAELLNVPNINETITALTETIKDAVTAEQTQAKAETPVPVVSASVTVKPVETVLRPLQGDLTLEAADVAQTDIPEAAVKPAQAKAESGGADSAFSQDSAFLGQAEQKPETAQATEDAHIAAVDAAKSGGDTARVVKTESAAAQARAANPQEVVKQVTEFIKADVKGNVSEVKLTLKPETLGELSLKVSIENGIVTAQFAAENARVKGILEASMNELRDALTQSGVNVGAIDVSVTGNNESETMRAYEREKQKSARRISKLIAQAGLSQADAPEARLVSESEVLENAVNYTA